MGLSQHDAAPIIAEMTGAPIGRFLLFTDPEEWLLRVSIPEPYVPVQWNYDEYVVSSDAPEVKPPPGYGIEMPTFRDEW